MRWDQRGVLVLSASALALTLASAPAGAAGGRAVADDDAVELFTLDDPRITESSGLATGWSLPGVLWTVNDSGGAPTVYGVDDRGRTVATVTLVGARARDWEAVSVGPRAGGRSWLWVADIGDNLSTWPTVRVYRVAEPTEPGDRSPAWTAYDLRYPDGPRDAETLLVDPDDGRLYVVSKRVQGAAVYRAPRRLRPDRVNVLTLLSSAPPLVTDGAFARDGRVALRDYLQASVSERLGAPSDRVALPLLQQGESLTWTTDGRAVLVGSEGADSPVWRVPVPAGEPAGPQSPSPSAEPSSVPPAPPSAPGPPAGPGVTEGGSSGLPVAWLTVLVGLAVGGSLGWARAVHRRRVDDAPR